MIPNQVSSSYEDKLITKEIDDVRRSQFQSWHLNTGVASMRFSSSSESSGFPSMVGLKKDHDDGDSESVRLYRAESLSS